VEDIQARHPQSRVSVHNGPNETIALAYARLIMANQTIAGISTFGVFPAVSTFGTGYLSRPKGGNFPNYWMFNPRIDELVDNVRISTDGDSLMVADMKTLWETKGEAAVLEWFRSDSTESAAAGTNVASVEATATSHTTADDSVSDQGVDASRAVQASEPTAKESSRKALVLEYNGYDAMNDLVDSYHGSGNVVCERIRQERLEHQNSVDSNELLPIVVNISGPCIKLYQKSGFGTGNFIGVFYGMRLMTRVHQNVGLSITCTDASEDPAILILPWLTGWFPPRTEPLSPDHALWQASQEQKCFNYQESPIAHLVHQIQHDFRRMAIGLVGIPGPDHPSAQFARDYLSESTRANDDTAIQWQLDVSTDNAPLFPSVEVDDAVIHFRCGDLMISDNPFFGFVKFETFMQHISSDARSIGIITQPFATQQGGVGQSRWVDQLDVAQDRCRPVVTALVADIQARHPQSRVSVHNGPNETIALAYARLIMANQTIAGISTFGVFPAVSTFGTGYLSRPKGGNFPNYWMFNPHIDELVDNVRISTDGDSLMVADMKTLWETKGEAAVLEWFRSDSTEPAAGEADVNKPGTSTAGE
jgi:hypothetical protein